MYVNIICANLVFMDLINPFGFSGDVTGYINIHNPRLFTFGNTKLQYMSATTQVAAKKIKEQNHKRALSAMEGVPSQDTTWEYEQILQHPSLELLKDKKSWVGRTTMSPSQ